MATGQIHCKTEIDGLKALTQYYQDIASVVRRYKPHRVVIEDIYNSNVETFKGLAFKHGIAILAICTAVRQSEIPEIKWIKASSVRSELGIPGKKRTEIKPNVCKWANSKFGLKLKYDPKGKTHDDDIADALTTCYMGALQLENEMSSSEDNPVGKRAGCSRKRMP